MLVDNGVNGDSRVQKAARSMAEAGWNVTLLGLSPDGKDRSWRIGAAAVKLLPVRRELRRRRLHLKRSWLRYPFSCPPGSAARRRLQLAQARRADLRARSVARGRRFRVRGLVAKARLRWAELRLRHTEAAWASASEADRLGVRMSTAFWKTVRPTRCWRRLEPLLWSYELALGHTIDRLGPDVIHANDFRMLGVGARAKLRARAAGRDVKLVWDAHEFLPGLVAPNERWMTAHCAYEKEYAPHADAVVTVSEGLADLLVTGHGLTERPAIVMNAPVRTLTDEQRDTPLGDLRELCGIGPGTSLLAYCGGIAPQRGVDVMVEALPRLPGVHIALVSLHKGKTTADALTERARELGVADRVHALPYVPHWQVPEFLATADLAVSPLLHLPNHEIALSNKFFEYSQARLPLVVSDIRTMAAMVRATGQGEVYRAGDLDDYVRAVRAVLADPDAYRAAYDKPDLLENWTWEAQAEVLDGVYARVLPGVAPRFPQRTPEPATSETGVK
ncbi:glycosyltransferase family 4 protein [Streptomyces sp. SID14478]|uniref:glycosyltransferase family 4 protein n=1 Tax=Streptomyces sp. SID14478 TaxID=2706073 RepID=UPI0013E06B3D|nr:glycosyltransferase family 4 protein [Streptomyces sp. SID14478]NEB81017.1 glycosyltransferase family 4 protein [Streptomyces sp. SID14478]